MALLDIIVTHYDEPWEVGKQFFDMIEHQRCVNPDDFAVTLVQDGKENELPWAELLKDYSFKVRIVTIPHSGQAVARNTGMKHTSSDWIMFCDFDDSFLDLCALNQILEHLPVTDYDIIWGKMIKEKKWNGETLYLHKVDNADYSSTDCKFYRRQFIQENNIRFDPRCPLYCEQMFNELALELTKPFRIVTLTTDFYMYLKTHREGSARLYPDNAYEMFYERWTRDKLLADEFRKRGCDFAYRKKIASMIITEYHRVYNPDTVAEPAEIPAAFLEFYKQHRNILRKLPQTELDVLNDLAETETMNLIQQAYNEYGLEFYFVEDGTSFEKWIDSIETQLTQSAERPDAPIETEQNRTGQRVAVYCGTYNKYQDMITSAKSLLWHTRMDKVYFLIEDDTFPYDLPDNGMIECINVKNQTWFQNDGPNYNNAWTYMCMMRAAFTKLIPYDKVLSLDIDVVVQEDIGCLWDIDMTDYYLAGVSEPQRQKSSVDPLYINFGVVMMNLAHIRRDGIDDKVISALNARKLGCPEQDAFNKICAGHIRQLPNDYNATVHSHITGECERERIIHYAGIKFWRHFGAVKEHSLRSWDDVMRKQAELSSTD